MKVLVTNYTFDASEKTITFTDYTSITLEAIVEITNVVDNIEIYDYKIPGFGGTVSTNVLTLEYDTTAMDDADELAIYYEDPDAQEVNVLHDSTGNDVSTTAAALNTFVTNFPSWLAAPTEYLLTLTNANTEYSYALSDNTYAVQFRSKKAHPLRYSFNTGYVAGPTSPYMTLTPGTEFFLRETNFTGVTIYFASPVAGDVVEILTWT